MSTLDSPLTPLAAEQLRAPRLSQMIEELTTAPSSIVLNGYTFTSLPSTALSPTKTSSPITTPSSQRTLARRLLARPMTVPRMRARAPM